MLSACSSSKKVSASTATTPATSAPTAAAPATSAPTTAAASPFASAAAPSANPGFTISIVKVPNSGGLALVGPDGHSLYIFDKDTGTTSACTGGCSAIWPGLKAAGTPTLGPGLKAAELTTAPSGQLMYNNHLLYNFSPDKAPGDTNGVSIPGWHLVSPLGTPVAGR